MKQRGKRIRPSGKDLVFHFTIASLLPVFLLVVGLFHVKTIQQINWQDFNLSQADKIDIPYLIISFSVAILICLLVAFVFKRVRYDTVKQLYHRQKLAKMILENKWYESEQVKQKKQPASSVHERPTTRQEQYHDEQTSKQSNIQTSYKESQQAKQERPAVKSDFSSPKVERQGNTVQEKTVQKPATSTTTADRTSQRPITKERPSTVQRVPLQNTRSRPPIKTATIKKVGKKP
ncbi:Tn916 ORF15 signal peptide containing protein [Streptococcus pneumoniae]|nr:Tn916 ORF15 signal peptide containing protein [Streptococcus pneumoniae]VMU35640.1 Tn916 ORF15 signal peptide containing protein [Streptococcus pneumoniae]VNT52753.1 Tn916 ORF15 signal peptide containing protein [Streptococcus pneumoniae]VPJ76144.1 Tn916 ORF15 signal peptide containing protein [Streptococcus pneumoniae]VPK62008.1 Tn916 ORF15 signal peptide containing protein [Streptococcus pneumoniae]